MLTTPNLNLTLWDQTKDGFSHSTLLSNFEIIDTHDHSPGKGARIGTASINPSAVTTNLIAPAAVTQTQMAANSVGSAQIQNGAVGPSKIAAGAVYGPAIPNGAITSPMLDPGILPLGSVITWWRPSGSNALPGGGWEIMDGRPWNSITNTLGPGGAALASGNIPNMLNAFAIGGSLATTPGVGSTGGSNTANLAHSHAVAQHSHSVPPHTHTINTDGNHFHPIMGLGLWARQNAFPIGITVNDHSGVQRQNTYYTLYLQGILSTYFGAGGSTGTLDAPAPMDNAGSHNHGGATVASNTLTSGAAAATTDSQLGSVNITPQYVALLYIMKVR